MPRLTGTALQSRSTASESWRTCSSRLPESPEKEEISIEKRALLTFCADNGVVEENVTQSGQEVTATVAENFLQEKATAAILCRGAHADLFPIDIGMARDTKVPRYKVAYGTKICKKARR